MKGTSILFVLFKLKILTPSGLYRFISALQKYGLNLMILLTFVKKGNKIAIVDDVYTITYKQLRTQIEGIAIALKQTFKLQSGKKVGFFCENHRTFIQALFACSLLGVDLYLLNAKMNKNQLKQLLREYELDLLIYDTQYFNLIKTDSLTKVPTSHPIFHQVTQKTKTRKCKFSQWSVSKLFLLTGGTTGKPKKIAHKPSISAYIGPFFSVLQKLRLVNYQTIYIATPLYHGYGLATLFAALALGKKIIICKKFDAENACRLIAKQQVEVVIAVPFIVQQLIHTKPEKLSSLRCIASGSAELRPKLVSEVFQKLGPILYNLYGTTEAGLSIIATPQDLLKNRRTIGKPISGVSLQILDDKKNNVPPYKVGQLCVKKGGQWIETGDLAYQDEEGYYFLCGRTDDMIISGGINVYPLELEHVLVTHPKIEHVAVIGVKDERFGERLHAFVQLKQETNVTKVELMDWLKSKTAPYQRPKEITFLADMPHTHIGKIDKKQLHRTLLY